MPASWRAAIAMLSLGPLALAGCGDGDGNSPVTNAQPAQDGAPTQPQPPGAGAQAGSVPAAKSNLSGSVSGLSGSVTAFAVRETATSTIVEMATDTLFAFDSSKLSPQAQESLTKVADLIRRGGSGEIVVGGHTDGVGSDSYNTELSRRRAEAVRDWLVAEHVAPAARFLIDAAGKSRPKVPNANADGSDNPEARAQNRRVEVIIPKG